MRGWIPFVVFLTAITAPLVVAANVLFGVQVSTGSSWQVNAADPTTIALSVLVGVMMSFILAAIASSIVLRFRRKAPEEPPRRRRKTVSESTDSAIYEAHTR